MIRQQSHYMTFLTQCALQGSVIYVHSPTLLLLEPDSACREAGPRKVHSSLDWHGGLGGTQLCQVACPFNSTFFHSPSCCCLCLPLPCCRGTRYSFFSERTEGSLSSSGAEDLHLCQRARLEAPIWGSKMLLTLGALGNLMTDTWAQML